MCDNAQNEEEGQQQDWYNNVSGDHDDAKKDYSADRCFDRSPSTGSAGLAIRTCYMHPPTRGRRD
jgi:hypothetical protein